MIFDDEVEWLLQLHHEAIEDVKLNCVSYSIKIFIYKLVYLFIFITNSKELNLYYRSGSTRPIYSIRHTYIKNRYEDNPANLEIIARQSNTSSKMLHSNYLDDLLKKDKI